jgi:hypothetical protein
VPKTAQTPRGLCFVIMSFADDPVLKDCYRFGIQRPVQRKGYRCVRADEIQHDERITDVIVDQIKRADYLVADLTHERPNCYYELGYAHALGKRVIVTARKGATIHFDVKDWNFIQYDGAVDLCEKLTKRLAEPAAVVKLTAAEARLRPAIEGLLEAAARALVHPHSDRVIRAFCHKADPATKELVPFCSWHPGDDSGAHIPFEGKNASGFVIVRAFREKRIMWKDDPPRPRKYNVWRDLKSVLAAPVRDYNDDEDPCWGTICFDSDRSAKEMGFDSDGARKIVRLIARSIHRLLTGLA